MVKLSKNTICLWYNKDAADAARFYAKTFHQVTLDYLDGGVARVMSPENFRQLMASDPSII